jgi:hypothetical protein
MGELTCAHRTPDELRDLRDDVGQQVDLTDLRQARDDVADAAWQQDDVTQQPIVKLGRSRRCPSVVCQYQSSATSCSSSAGQGTCGLRATRSWPETTPGEVCAEEGGANEAVVCAVLDTS